MQAQVQDTINKKTPLLVGKDWNGGRYGEDGGRDRRGETDADASEACVLHAEDLSFDRESTERRCDSASGAPEQDSRAMAPR